MILLSIIVPAYNQEKCIIRTLSSIVSQMTSETELIIINDGSTDNTNIVVEQFIASNSQNIRFINQNNIGLLKTREKGTQLSSGLYIWHVDSGDEICEGSIITIIKYIKLSKFHCFFLNYIEENIEGKKIYHTYNKTNDLKNFFMGKCHPSIWSKVIKKDVMLNIYNNIYDKEITLGEDMCQVFELLIKSPSVKVIDNFCYKYIRDVNSMTLGSNRYSITNAIKYMSRRVNEEKTELKEEFKYFAYNQLIIQHLLLKNNRNNYSDIFNLYKSLDIRNNIYIKHKTMTIFLVKLKKYLPIKEELLTNLYNKAIGVFNEKK